ncbi:MAG: flagellar basal body L-ring protein, partial [Caulobacter sp. 35-67-4]
MRPALIAALALLAPLAACSTVTEAVKGPELAPVGYPAQLAPMTQQFASNREVAPQAASANSLWRVGARAFFNDQRAGKVGDILTVQIDIDDSVNTKNTTASSRT